MADTDRVCAARTLILQTNEQINRWHDLLMKLLENDGNPENQQCIVSIERILSERFDWLNDYELMELKAMQCPIKYKTD